MKKVIILIIIVLTLGAFLIVKNNSLNKRKYTKIEAASAFFPYTKEMVQDLFGEQESKNEDLLQMVSTAEAFEDIVNKKTEVIVATQPSDEQKEMIEESGTSLNYLSLYMEPLAILVNSSSPINDITIKEIQEIYYGGDLGWNTYQLEKNNGSQTCFESIVKNNELGRNHYSIITMPEIIDKVAEDKHGICYAFYSYYSRMHTNEGAKIINVNGKSITDSEYPLLFYVYLIYRDDSDKDILNKLLIDQK